MTDQTAPVEVALLHQLAVQSAVPLVLAMRAQDGRAPNEAWADRMLRDFLARDLGRFLVAKRGEQVIGYLALLWGYSLSKAAPSAFVQELFVLPQERGQGVGTHLLRHAEDYARRYGAGRLWLQTDADNAAARKLSGRVGLVEWPDKLTLSKAL